MFENKIKNELMFCFVKNHTKKAYHLNELPFGQTTEHCRPSLSYRLNTYVNALSCLHMNVHTHIFTFMHTFL